MAKSVAGILSRGNMRVRNGRSVYNKIFEFAYTIGGQQCDMAMTSVTGHLMELDFDDQYRKWHSCDPVDLFQAPVRKKVPQVWQILDHRLLGFFIVARQKCNSNRVSQTVLGYSNVVTENHGEELYCEGMGESRTVC